MNQDAIETKLAAARAKLILDKPFLGALVLRLPMKPAKPEWCPTTATDARAFYYNPEYIDSLSLAQTQFMLSHEALHCALSHFSRRQHRIKHRWDLACDFAINPLLLEDGLTPPPNAKVLDDYKGMTAEEIYPLLEETENLETLDQHVYDRDNEGGGSGDNPPEHETPKPNEVQNGEPQRPDPIEERDTDEQCGGQAEARPEGQQEGQEIEQVDNADTPPPLGPTEQETLQVQWQQRLAGAAQQAMQAGKLGGSLARMIDHLLQPQLPWRMLLARYMTGLARDDFSYMRPSRREGEAILPSLRSAQVDVIIAIDTSGSVKPGEIDEFVSEVDALKGQMRAHVTLLPCDAELAGDAPLIFEPWEEFRCPPSMGGGGGTDFRPVFDWIDRQGRQPDLLVYFTDAEGKFPDAEPNFPVIWLVKGKTQVPWGQRVQLN